MNNYDHFGVMLDCSRNAVMKPEQVMRFIDCLEKMGYNTLELYAEDTYKIEGEPYAGYMRGGYTGEEIRAIDAYAAAHGIELIPCIQTLAHFTNLVKLSQYKNMVDTADILLIDEPRTYEFIENIFKTLSANFTSRKVNIGMDEAHMVGLGKYLDKHGFENRFELLARHLSRVLEIAKRYGFTAHMWSDMFFRLANGGDYYGENKLDRSVIDLVPDGVELTYWDYYHADLATYDRLLEAHLEVGKRVWFAGGAWTWRGFAPRNGFSLLTMRPAMESVRSHGIRDVLITVWGDNGGECSFFSVLPSLYAMRQYAEGNFDEGAIKDGFEDLFGVTYDSFMRLDDPEREVSCKAILYGDCFQGQVDEKVKTAGRTDYEAMAKDLQRVGKQAGEFVYIFRCLSSLCRVLDIKQDLGIRTRQYYGAEDREGLMTLTGEYDRCVRRLKVFYRDFKALWFKENKGFGWEIQDARLGGLMLRLQSCRDMLRDYLDDRLARIDELEEPLLAADRPYHLYREAISYSEM